MLFENPVPILAMGAVLITLCGLIFLSKRTMSALVALLAVVGLTLVLLACQWLVVTDSEAVEIAQAELLQAIEDNETPAAVALIDPQAAKLRSDIELLMPMIKVSDTGSSSVMVEVESSANPQAATSRFRGKLQGVHTRSGMQVLYFDDVEMNWIKTGNTWLLQDFTAYFKGKPLNALESARSNSPARSGS